jgi:hypothetical protein
VTPGRRSPRQRGAASILVVAGALALAVVAVGAAGVGSVSVHRVDAQRAADAAALAALGLARDRGLPLDSAARRAAASVGDDNSALALRFDWRVRREEGRVTVEVDTRGAVARPSLLGGGASEIRVRSRAALTELRFDRADRRRPALALVLDYSASMTDTLTGGRQPVLDVLEAAVAELLARDLPIDYGAVLFGDDVVESVAISEHAGPAITRALGRHDAHGETATGDALTRALGLVAAVRDQSRHVLLISDGEPCCDRDAVGRAQQAALALWNGGVTIFTLELRRQNANPVLSQVMAQLAGTPTDHSAPAYHYVATSEQALIRQLDQIATTIACTIGPLVPAPRDEGTVRVYLENGGRERPVARSTDLVADADRERYAYGGGQRSLRLSAAACDAIDAGAAVIVRHGQPTLIP